MSVEFTPFIGVVEGPNGVGKGSIGSLGEILYYTNTQLEQRFFGDPFSLPLVTKLVEPTLTKVPPTVKLPVTPIPPLKI